MTETFTKEILIEKLRDIRDRGWISSGRQGNHGGVGNTLEDLLGIEENNLPIPNAAEWELKCRRLNSNSLVTLCHMEPSPNALRFIPSILLPQYGWEHKKAGHEGYSTSEKSFRQTINCNRFSDRGFGVVLDRVMQKVLISFDATKVGQRHSSWLSNVEQSAGLLELNPQPYWGFSDLHHKVGTKLKNCFFVEAARRKTEGLEYFKYENISMLSSFSMPNFLDALEQGLIYVDFDARTGHNHGTKFRIRSSNLISLYENVQTY